MDSFKSILENLRSTMRKTNTTHQEICDSLDIVSDHILSNKGKVSKEILPFMFQTLLPFFKPQTFWCYKHTILFCFNHIFSNNDINVIKPFIGATVKVYCSTITDSKREVRDAVGLSLGVMVKIMGFNLLNNAVLGALNALRNVSGKEKYHCMEGLVLVIGDILSCLPYSNRNEHKKAFMFLFNVLLEKNSTKKFDFYSKYIRLYSTRSFCKVFQKGNIKLVNELIAEKKINEEMLKKMIDVRMKDDDFDVRREGARLFYSYNYLYKYKLLNNNNVKKKEYLEFLLKSIIKRLNECPKDQWTWAFSYSYCIKLLLQNKDFVSTLVVKNDNNIDIDVAKYIFMCLKKEILKSKKEGMKSSQSSSECGVSYISFYISLYNINNKIFGKKFYMEYVHEIMKFMLTSSKPNIIDSAAVCVEIMLNVPECLKNISKQLEIYACLVYKNKFHAALAINVNAKKVWKKMIVVLSSLRLESHKNIFTNEKMYEKEFISYLIHEGLLYILLKEVDNKNYEVKESVFKAISSVITKENIFMLKISIDNMLKLFLKESVNKSTGEFSDMPRNEAIKAVKNVLCCIANVKNVNKKGEKILSESFLKQFFGDHLVGKYLSVLLKDLYDGDVFVSTMELLIKCILQFPIFSDVFIPAVKAEKNVFSRIEELSKLDDDDEVKENAKIIFEKLK